MATHPKDKTTPLFLTTAQLGEWLNMGSDSAKKILIEHGILPVDLGRGRGKGLRWRTSAVIKFADTLHAEAQAKQHPRRKAPYSLKGKSVVDLLAEFKGNVPMTAEASYGY